MVGTRKERDGGLSGACLAFTHGKGRRHKRLDHKCVISEDDLRGFFNILRINFLRSYVISVNGQ